MSSLMSSVISELSEEDVLESNLPPTTSLYSEQSEHVDATKSTLTLQNFIKRLLTGTLKKKDLTERTLHLFDCNQYLISHDVSQPNANCFTPISASEVPAYSHLRRYILDLLLSVTIADSNALDSVWVRLKAMSEQDETFRAKCLHLLLPILQSNNITVESVISASKKIMQTSFCKPLEESIKRLFDPETFYEALLRNPRGSKALLEHIVMQPLLDMICYGFHSDKNVALYSLGDRTKSKGTRLDFISSFANSLSEETNSKMFLSDQARELGLHSIGLSSLLFPWFCAEFNKPKERVAHDRDWLWICVVEAFCYEIQHKLLDRFNKRSEKNQQPPTLPVSLPLSIGFRCWGEVRDNYIRLHCELSSFGMRQFKQDGVNRNKPAQIVFPSISLKLRISKEKRERNIQKVAEFLQRIAKSNLVLQLIGKLYSNVISQVTRAWAGESAAVRTDSESYENEVDRPGPGENWEPVNGLPPSPLLSKDYRGSLNPLAYQPHKPATGLLNCTGSTVRLLSGTDNGLVILDQRNIDKEVVYKLTYSSSAAIRELRVLNILGESKHTPRLLGAWREPKLPETVGESQVVIEMEYISTSRVLDENSFRKFARGLLEGIAFLHKKGIIHSDIKPSNCRFTPSGNVILLDFGCSGRQGKDGKMAVVGYSTRYAAPEILMKKEDGLSVRIGTSADVFSAGVTLLSILLRMDSKQHRNFGAHSILEFWRVNWSFPAFKVWFVTTFLSHWCLTPDWVSEVLDLAFSMTNLEESRRPQCEHLLSYHPFLTS